ncbi:S49 family peptidase [Haloferax sp. Atlit-19N]|uniref:S49 family peptidase n=1 Tax=Haloferax TaxID=2251 RepID=UPI00067913EE|nr:MULTISPECIES: S49 family peptidase [Haloferax]RDZ48364.1 S49 family peptidase [Haloferax sp. Atlit-19N]
MVSKPSSAASARTVSVLALVAAVLVGAFLAPVVYDAAAPTPDRVAVISVDGTITSYTADQLEEDLHEARENESIKAVVLQVDSPGGSAAASERMYLAVNRTAQEMPVVSSVQGTGASGAYYTMLPSENIYVTPSSVIGSVGVRGSAPIGGTSSEIRTGPDKASMTLDHREAQIETLKHAFVGSVMDHRGDELSLSREEVAYAKVYTGARATQNGYADDIGTLQTAIDRAASEAGLENYEVVEKEPPTRSGIILLSSQNGNSTVVIQESPIGYDGVRSPQFLMVYGQVQYEDEVIGNVSA